MILLEREFLEGIRYEDTVTNDDGETVPRRFMGGVKWFLEQWELGNTGNGGAFNYRPGGSDVSASAWATTDDKRILDINGTITKSQFYMILERLFRKTNDKNFEKLCLCGSGFIAAFNEFIDNSTVVNRKLFETDKGGFNIKEWESPHGSIFLKSSPLMNEDAVLRNSAYFLDLAELKYIHAQDADTALLENRQANDADKRKDEWLTECSLELKFPEAHMYLENVTGITN
jgi:hypothetical protein